MFKCNYCSKSYTWPDSLKRHTRRMHDDEDRLADSESCMSMDPDDNACGHCGALFNSLSSLAKHAEKCETQDSDSDVSAEGEEDESALKAIIQTIYSACDSQYQTKVASYEAAGDENAAQTARDDMRPIYKRNLRKALHAYLTFAIQIKKSEHYKKLMKDINYYKDDKGYEVTKAVKKAISKNGNILDELLDDANSDNTDDSEDNDDGSSAESGE